MTPTHPSDLALDEFALGASPDPAAIEAHVGTCLRCRAHLARLESARLDFAARPVPRALPSRSLPSRSLPRRLAAVGTVLAAAAGLMLWLRPAPAPEPEYSFKGEGPIATVRVNSDTPLVEGMSLRPGDRLSFRVFEPGRQVLVLSVDGSGALSVFHPFGGEESALVPGDGRLPATIELDEAPGPERLFVLSAAAPLTVASFRAQLQGLSAEEIRRGPALRLPKEVRLFSVSFEKAR